MKSRSSVIIVGHFDIEGDSKKKLRESIIALQLYKLEHLVSKDHIPVVLESNLGPPCLMLVAFYHTKDEGVMENCTSLNLLHSRFPRSETHIESLHSQDSPSSYRQTDVRQILFSNKNQN
jgi:hypothetical protein